MKKNIRVKKLALATLTLKELTVDRIVDAKGGAELPRTSLRPDCACT
jgi:hypothetical protein